MAHLEVKDPGKTTLLYTPRKTQKNPDALKAEKKAAEYARNKFGLITGLGVIIFLTAGLGIGGLASPTHNPQGWQDFIDFMHNEGLWAVTIACPIVGLVLIYYGGPRLHEQKMILKRIELDETQLKKGLTDERKVVDPERKKNDVNDSEIDMKDPEQAKKYWKEASFENSYKHIAGLPSEAREPILKVIEAADSKKAAKIRTALNEAASNGALDD